MKICRTCGHPKSLDEFHKNKKSADNRQPDCKTCAIAKRQDYYKRNWSAQRSKMNAAKESVRQENKRFVIDYLLKHPCLDCGEKDPVVLEFDHVRGDKVDDISRMITASSLLMLSLEITKCEVRCANCHRRITHKRRQKLL